MNDQTLAASLAAVDCALSATLAGLAEAFASCPDGAAMPPATIRDFVAVLNEAQATAWAMEMALKLCIRADRLTPAQASGDAA